MSGKKNLLKYYNIFSPAKSFYKDYNYSKTSSNFEKPGTYYLKIE